MQKDVVTQAMSWRDLFKANAKPNLVIEAQELKEVEVDGELVFEVPDDIVQDGIDRWKNSLVGQFLRNPSFWAVKAMVDRHWKDCGHVKISTLDNGLYVFSFKDEECCFKILAQSWHINNNPLILRRWEPDLEMENFHAEAMPVWIKASNIPMSLWSSRGLGAIAGKVGKPLVIDSVTSEGDRLGFAKMHLVVNMNKELRRMVPMRVRGKVHKIRIDYLGLPEKCIVCNDIGHGLSECPVRPASPPEHIAKEGVETVQLPHFHATRPIDNANFSSRRGRSRARRESKRRVTPNAISNKEVQVNMGLVQTTMAKDSTHGEWQTVRRRRGREDRSTTGYHRRGRSSSSMAGFRGRKGTMPYKKVWVQREKGKEVIIDTTPPFPPLGDIFTKMIQDANVMKALQESFHKQMGESSRMAGSSFQQRVEGNDRGEVRPLIEAAEGSSPPPA